MLDNDALDSDVQEYLKSYKPLKRKPLIDTGRKPMRVEKYPQDLDFSKTLGGTTYVVKSHFTSSANECLLGMQRRSSVNPVNILLPFRHTDISKTQRTRRSGLWTMLS